MDYDTKYVVRKIILDLLLIMCVGFPILIFFLLGEPYKRGFFCDDESLQHPFHPSTVPSYYLYIFGLGMPILVMILTEYVHSRDERQKSAKFGNCRIPLWVWNAYCIIIVFGFGATCSQLLTDIMKYSVGRLRPHFFNVCQPNINCSLPSYQHVYIESFQCKDDQNGRLLKEMRLSFPSGHSSFSMYTMFFLAIYLQARWTWKGSKLFRHFFQYIFVLLAVYTAMTRISDYKHHWSDVLTGLLLGVFVAVIVARCISDLFTKRNHDILPTIVDGSESEMAPRIQNGTSQL